MCRLWGLSPMLVDAQKKTRDEEGLENHMKRSITRTKDGRFCTVEITLENGRLSITGAEGRVVPRAAAKKEALEHWKSYFDSEPGQIHSMNQKDGTRFSSSTGAAKYVLAANGELYGLDSEEKGDGKVLIGESWGQLTDVISDFFPEVKPLLPWHLNDMKPGCEHQDELGWGHGKTIALTADSLTPAQRDTIQVQLLKKYKTNCDVAFRMRWREITTMRSEAIAFIKLHNGGTCSVDQLEHLMSKEKVFRVDQSQDLRSFDLWLKEDIRKDVKSEEFDAAIYKDSIGAPCPTCGYRYGSEWLKRELPAEIVELASTVCAKEETK